MAADNISHDGEREGRRGGGEDKIVRSEINRQCAVTKAIIFYPRCLPFVVIYVIVAVLIAKAINIDHVPSP